jgi:outer membrane protein assembly factor BamB
MQFDLFLSRKHLSPYVLLVAGMLAVSSAPVFGGGEWPQFGGPDRNFMSKSKGLADRWPEGGPKQLWKRELGDGYSTIVVDDGVLYTMYRPARGEAEMKAEENPKRFAQEVEITVAIDAATGKTIWEHKHPSAYTNLMADFGAGPHTTPLVDGPYVYTIGTNAVMHCYDKKSGKVVWKHDLVEEFGAPIPGRGYGASPIVYKDTIIAIVDRTRDDAEGEGEGESAEKKEGPPAEGRSLVAFQKDSGSVAWKSRDYPTTYASPILINFQGEEQLVVLLSKAMMGVDPNSGNELWYIELNPEGANLSSPMYNGKDLIFCSSAYDSGSRVVKLSKTDGKTVAEQVWYGRKMRVHHGNVIGLGDVVYGSSGDFGPAFFMAVDIKTGDVLWRERGFKKANCVYADGKMIILDEDGELALATVKPDGMMVHSRAKIGEPYAWAAPTLVGSKLFVRDRKHVMAFELGAN